MRLDINLATRPYEDAREFWGRWGLGVGLLGVLTLVLLAVATQVVAQVLSFHNFPRTILIYDAIITFILIGLTRFIVVGLTTEQESSAGRDPWFPFLRVNAQRWLQDGVTFFGVTFGGLAIYMLWNKVVFGTFSPVSGQIKRWWGSLSGRVYDGPARSLPAFPPERGSSPRRISSTGPGSWSSSS